MRISGKTAEDITRETEEAAQREAKEEIALSGLAEKSYQEAEDWVDQIADLNSAKARMKVMAKVILALVKERKR